MNNHIKKSQPALIFLFFSYPSFVNNKNNIILLQSSEGLVNTIKTYGNGDLLETVVSIMGVLILALFILKIFFLVLKSLASRSHLINYQYDEKNTKFEKDKKT